MKGSKEVFDNLSQEWNTSGMDQTTTEQQPVATPPPAHKSNNMLVFVLLGIILLLIGLGGGYYISNQSKGTPPPTNSTTTGTTPTQTMSNEITPTKSESKAIWTTYTSTQLASVSLKPYSIQYPQGWTPTHQTNDVTDTYTLTKGTAVLSITQSPTGGSGCVFDGPPPGPGPMQDLRNTPNVEIETASGVKLRRFLASNPQNVDKTVYDFCSTADGTNWGTPTQFGIMRYTSADALTDAQLTEMDSILKTLQIVK